MVYIFSVLVAETGLSSNNILDAGELSSSNCPVFTLHKKASRKREATLTLAIRSITMTLICFFYDYKNIWRFSGKR